MKKVFALMLVLIFGFLGFIAVQPAHMMVSREIVIAAAPDFIFPHLNNARLAYEWMPWQEMDPSVQISYLGADEGVGAISEWQGKGQMGVGRSEVIESVPNEVIKTQLSYTKPMAMTQLSEITLKSTEMGTLVKWQVTGENSFLGRLMCFFIDMDKEVGGQFEKGLNNLKTKVESSSL
jgi:uncharacterized protein YndB with AHSA1/START domain